jgi:hypothetical protein
MVVPVYIAEWSPSRVRGSLVSLQQFLIILITVGILLRQVASSSPTM